MTLLDLNWLMVVLPIACFLLVGALQFWYFYAYIGWNPPIVVVNQALLTAVLFGYGFWVGSIFAIDKAAFGDIAVFAALFAIGILLASFIVSVIIHKKESNWAAYDCNICTVDLIMIVTLVLSLVRLYNEQSARGLMISAPFLYVAVVAAAILVVRKVAPSAFLATKFNFGTFQDELPEGNGKKVKVVLITGQSNASGVSRTPYLKKKMPEKYDKYVKGFNNVWINYFNDNGAMKSHGFVNVKAGQGCADCCFGPELGIGEILSEAYPDEPTFIVKYAWGGSNMYDQWLAPTSAKEEGRKTGSLYRAFIKFTTESLEHLKAKGYEPHIVANCWMQGESDASKEQAPRYKRRTITYATDSVNDLKDYVSDTKPVFVDAGISDTKLANGKYLWAEYIQINKVKKEAAGEINGIFMDTVAEGLSCATEPTGEFKDPRTVDYAHYDSVSGIKLGNMFGEAVVGYLKK